MRPYLLEVNHSPSFMTDSQVDLKVKGNLIYDTLRILKIGTKNKQRLMRMKKNQLNQRTLTGRRVKMNEGETRDRCLEEKDAFMLENKGGFERIFPPEKDEGWEPYQEFLDQAEKLYKQFTGADNYRPAKKTIISPINILTYSKRYNTLEKIYGYKSKRHQLKKRRNKSMKDQKLRTEDNKRNEHSKKMSTVGVKLAPINPEIEDVKLTDTGEVDAKDLAEIKEANKSREEGNAMKSEEILRKSQPLVENPKTLARKLKGSFNKTLPSNSIKNEASKETLDKDKIILERLNNLPQVSPQRLTYNPSIGDNKLRIKNLISQSSTNSLIQIKKGKRSTLRPKNKKSFDSKNKYLVSPYMEADPFLSFNKNYKQKMKSLSIKLNRSSKR